MRTFGKLPSDDSVRNMTDEQWLWVYVNMVLENDELLEGMCPSCRKDATSTNKCTRCGKSIGQGGNDTFTNPNFNSDKFDKLMAEDSDAIIVKDK